MKQLKRFTAVILVITFLFCAFWSAEAFNSYNMSVFYDSSGIYACEYSGNTVTVKGVNNSISFNYTFNTKLISYCISRGTLYAATASDQPNSIMICAVKNGKSTSSILINSKKLTARSSLCVDSDGRIYLSNSQKKIEVYDAKGKYIKTTSNVYISFIGLKGRIYAANASGIYRLSGTSESLVCKCGAGDGIYPASDNCIAVLSGAVYNIVGGDKVFSNTTERMYTTAVTSKYVFVLKDNTVYVYGRSKGNLINSYELGYTAYAVCAEGDTVYILSDGSNKLSVKKYKGSNFLPPDSTNSDSSSVVSTDISFGKYKTSGKYIFLPPLLTRAEFRSEISYDGYSLKFNKSSGLGTNTNAVFTKDKNSYTYTIIVKGDITGTGRINDDDIDILFNCLFGIDKVGGIYKTAADMNGDGKLSNVDLVMQDRNKN